MNSVLRLKCVLFERYPLLSIFRDGDSFTRVESLAVRKFKFTESLRKV